jgi:hypothetical protein
VPASTKLTVEPLTVQTLVELDVTEVAPASPEGVTDTIGVKLPPDEVDVGMFEIHTVGVACPIEKVWVLLAGV